MKSDEIIKKLGPWFHNIYLPDGTQTAPDHFLGNFPSYKWEKIKKEIPENLEGWKVLDIGCNAGFYSIELAKRGAEVLAIDLDEHYLKQARFVAEKFELSHRITFCQMQVYDLARLDQKFDMIWFMGVFYHLRYPLLALDIVTKKTGKCLVFQTLLMGDKLEMEIPEDVGINDREILQQKAWPSMAFIEHKLAGDPTNWWVANHTCILSLLRNCGFREISQPDTEIYIASFPEDENKALDSWNSSEYLSAIGKEWRLDVIKKTKKD